MGKYFIMLYDSETGRTCFSYYGPYFSYKDAIEAAEYHNKNREGFSARYVLQEFHDNEVKE